jgi:hypothetical protein
MIVKVFLLAALLVFAVLLAWAFQSRGMPALKVWRTVVLRTIINIIGVEPRFSETGSVRSER